MLPAEPGTVRIAGVDPGAAATGYGVIDWRGTEASYVAAGVIRSPRRASLAARLRVLHERMLAVLEECQPDVLAVETLFHARSPRTGIVLGHARGVLLLAGAQRDIAIVEYSPLQIKQSVTGRGGATKEQVATMLGHLVQVPEDATHDATDALAAAVCHAHRQHRVGP